MNSATNDRSRMRIAFISNIIMFMIGMVGWYFAESISLLADALDMLADASGYAIAFIAISRSKQFQKNAARWNGTMLIVLGVAILGEVMHRLINGSEPRGLLIVIFSTLSLIVNGSVLTMLLRYQKTQKMHLKAAWIDTRTDVVVNISVLLSGAAIALTGYQIIDLFVGFVIGLYVIKEGLKIWKKVDEDH